MVTPSGGATSPPPRAAGQAQLPRQPGPGRLFISSMAHLFLVYEVTTVPFGVVGLWPRCVSEAAKKERTAALRAKQASRRTAFWGIFEERISKSINEVHE